MQSRRIQNAFFVGLLVLTTLAFLGLIQNFLMPLFWAAVIAILFEPLNDWWAERTGDLPSVAAALSLLTIVVIVILPLFLIGLAVTQEATSVYQRLVAGDVDLSRAVAYVESLVPVATDFLEKYGVDFDELRQRLSNAAVGISRGLASRVLNLGQNAFQLSLDFFLMLYLLFFFLRDGADILDVIVGVVPLGDVRERRLLSKFAEVSRATIKGTLVVGVVQGTMGGAIFWILGIQGALLWGVVMTLLSLLPAVGAAIVWAPAAVILLLTGSVAEGVILLLFGTLIIGLADNVLRPLLVGRDTQMPDYLILISTLGGLTAFGVSGFVIGPVIAALFLTVWEMFGHEFDGATSSWFSVGGDDGTSGESGDRTGTAPTETVEAAEPSAPEDASSPS